MAGLHEECGIMGIFDIGGNDISQSLYYGLVSLQHRGQESCGMAVSDTANKDRENMNCHTGLGLVKDVLTNKVLKECQGNIGIGHVRYSTTGESSARNAQPLVLSYVKGTLALAHNGNLINTSELKWELIQNGAIFHTTTDSEVIAFHIARERVHSSSVEEAVKKTVLKLAGGYALVVKSPRKLVGVRDPHGLKPLCLGKKDKAFVLASESCALTSIGAVFLRDIKPGEIITISPEGIQSDLISDVGHKAHCIFEYIYFARLDSTIDGISVYESRIKGGKLLARRKPVDADLVAGVPESGLIAARGYAQESGIPFGFVFHKNSYVGRTFIQPSQQERESGVHMKLSVLPSAVKDKRIILIDDSIVRGTTMRKLIRMLREAGAREVHVRISSPPFLHPCYFGTDVPSQTQLIASNHDIAEICSMITADSLAYASIEDLDRIVDHLPVCKACFDGKYPMTIPRKMK